jgi:hypothetical protein
MKSKAIVTLISGIFSLAVTFLIGWQYSLRTPYGESPPVVTLLGLDKVFVNTISISVGDNPGPQREYISPTFTGLIVLIGFWLLFSLVAHLIMKLTLIKSQPMH